MKYIIILLILISFDVSAGVGVQPPTPPPQPASGPGGKEYLYNNVKVTKHSKGYFGYYIFEPEDYKQFTAPLIVFVHGWGAVYPYSYKAWIDHLVKKGNIVIYPTYQRIVSAPKKFTKHATDGLKRALEEIEKGNHIKPDLDRVGYIGHSAGGVIAVNFAVESLSDSNIPKPKFILSIEPGITTIPPESRKAARGRNTNNIRIPLLDVSKLPSNIYLITVSGDSDTNVFDHDAKKIYNETINIPKNNKAYIIMHSDYHGNPPLIADHFAPIAIEGNYKEILNLTENVAPEVYNKRSTRSGANALDYYGTWKLSDMLIDITFNNKDFQNLNASFITHYMGEWSDGTPVKEITIY